MSICGCSYNLYLRKRNSMIEVGAERFAFFESNQDFHKFIGFPYKEIISKGDIVEFKGMEFPKEIEVPKWANFFAIEKLR